MAEVTAAVRRAIDGYELTTKAHESPARRVRAGGAETGLGLASTAEKLGLSFVSLGAEPVTVVANPDRTGKPSVERLADLLAEDG
jgi:molybdate-binding protein